MLGAIKSSERFEKLPGEDIIRLNSDAQLLRVGDTIFVLDLKMLERNMGFSPLYNGQQGDGLCNRRIRYT